MKLTVISPEADDPRELSVLEELFGHGLADYHVRKPGWSRDQLAAYLRRVPAKHHPLLILHSHHDLAAEFGVGGVHERDDPAKGMAATPRADVGRSLLRSRAVHDLPALQQAIDRYDRVFLGPIFPSISKPGHQPRLDQAALKRILARPRRAEVFAVGGIAPPQLRQCRQLGFDGVAAHGAIWQDPAGPVVAYRVLEGTLRMEAILAARLVPVMALTQDGIALSHAEQARALVDAGARWIQLRMKDAESLDWLNTAVEVVTICHDAGAICTINDSANAAIVSGADGVHLGRLDQDWVAARKQVGKDMILGGTVNNAEDAVRAADSGVLDYVGIGPLRFTPTKRKLAPVLGPDGIAALLPLLDGLPAWAIGGVRPADLPALRHAGLAGVAVSSALYEKNRVTANYLNFVMAWNASTS